MLIQIKNCMNGNLIYECECHDIKEAIESAIKNKISLRWADLRSADLSSADLRWADLRSANLRSADLRWADLRWTDLSWADLSSADLSSADLRSADLRWADLRWTDLSSADLSSANFDLKYWFLSISPIGSEHGCLWTMRNDDGILKYNRGCFSGTKEEFIEAIHKKHGGTEQEKKYLAAIDFIEIQLGLKTA